MVQRALPEDQHQRRKRWRSHTASFAASPGHRVSHGGKHQGRIDRGQSTREGSSLAHPQHARSHRLRHDRSGKGNQGRRHQRRGPERSLGWHASCIEPASEAAIVSHLPSSDNEACATRPRRASHSDRVRAYSVECAAARYSPPRLREPQGECRRRQHSTRSGDLIRAIAA